MAKGGMIFRDIGLAVLGASVFAMCGSAQAKEQRLLSANFNDIVVSGDMQINIITGKPPKAVANGDKYFLDRLIFEQSNGVLRIGYKHYTSDKGTPNAAPLIIMLSTQQLRNIIVQGNASVRVDAIKRSDPSAILLSGSGSIEIDKLIAPKVEVTINGSGKIAIGSGKVNLSTVYLDGNASYDASAFISNDLMLQQNGNATAKAQIDKTAEITNNGAGTITLTGKGICQIKQAGAATIRCDHIAGVRNKI